MHSQPIIARLLLASNWKLAASARLCYTVMRGRIPEFIFTLSSVRLVLL